MEQKQTPESGSLMYGNIELDDDLLERLRALEKRVDKFLEEYPAEYGAHVRSCLESCWQLINTHSKQACEIDAEHFWFNHLIINWLYEASCEIIKGKI